MIGLFFNMFQSEVQGLLVSIPAFTGWKRLIDKLHLHRWGFKVLTSNLLMNWIWGLEKAVPSPTDTLLLSCKKSRATSFPPFSFFCFSTWGHAVSRRFPDHYQLSVEERAATFPWVLFPSLFGGVGELEQNTKNFIDESSSGDLLKLCSQLSSSWNLLNQSYKSLLDTRLYSLKDCPFC